MVKKGYTAEQIIHKLREAEIFLSQGSSILEASKKIGVPEQIDRVTDDTESVEYTAKVNRVLSKG